MPPERSDMVIVGCGTLGSALCWLVVRSSVDPAARPARLFLVDHDTLEAHNLPKSAVGGSADLGRPKVHVARDWAAATCPELGVTALPVPVERAGGDLFAHAWAVFVCADTYAAKQAAARAAWRRGVPVIVVGELAGGESLASRFRVFRPAPEAPCLECNWDREYLQAEAAHPCAPPPAAPAPGPATRLSVAARTAAHMLEEAERRRAAPADHPAEEVRVDGAARRFRTYRLVRNPDCRFDHRMDAAPTAADALAVAGTPEDVPTTGNLGAQSSVAIEATSGLRPLDPDPGVMDRRWARELAELDDVAARSGGRFRYVATPHGLRLFLTCRSPIADDAGAPVVEEVEHEVELLRPERWPAVPLTLFHRRPAGLVHPNVFRPGPDLPALLRGLPSGLVCYAQRHMSALRLATLVEHLYDMLGYRHGRYTRDLADCLAPEAVRWVNRVVADDPSTLPTERRPLVAARRPAGTRGAP